MPAKPLIDSLADLDAAFAEAEPDLKRLPAGDAPTWLSQMLSARYEFSPWMSSILTAEGLVHFAKMRQEFGRLDR